MKKNIRERDIDIVEFNSETGMEWKAWLLYFERSCKDSEKDKIWKIPKIQKFLKGKSLTRYINNSLNVLHREEFIQLFNEEFTTPGKLSLSDFLEITFKRGEDVAEYYQK